MTGVANRERELLRILIVDDRIENIASLRKVLERDDMEIVSALTGNEALSLMLDHDFALVLLDVQMPGMDGFEVAELMRRHERTRRVPVIFVTAISKERQHICSGYDAGAVDYLFKPVDPVVIRAKVAAFLELKRNQLARERLVDELNRANTRLREISDLKSDYLSAASHELRTPLTAIKEFCSLVHDGVVGEVNDEQRHCLGAALRNCNRLANLVNDLLDLDSIESGQRHLWRTRVDVGELLGTCRQDFDSRCTGAGQQLRVEIPGADEKPLPPALAAPEMVTQVLVNLVGNAHKFTPAGGEIVLRARSDRGRVVIEVQDNGPGIAPEDQERVFEKFAQLNRRDRPGAQGTGLGLPISRKIVELHGGRLDLASATGAGSCFRFDLPVYSDLAHLRAFVADGVQSPTGLPVPWHLVLLLPAVDQDHDAAATAATIEGMVRSSGDRFGRVVFAGQPAYAVLLQTTMTGALAFLSRLRALDAESFPAGRAARVALLDVSEGAQGPGLANPADVAFSALNSPAFVKPRGVLHV